MFTPSQLRIVPSGSTRKNSPSTSSGRRATRSRGVLGMRLPGPVRVGHAHEEDAPVPVDVLAVEAVLGLLARVRAHARAAAAAVREPRLGAVRVHARHDVERPRVERVRDAVVGPVPCRRRSSKASAAVVP